MDLLIVDDDRDHAGMLAAELRAFGHRVTVTGGSRDALRSLDQQPHDALILDWLLPRDDGLAMLRQLRAEHRTIPVIMLTGRGRLVDRVEGLEAGADDYVVKPVAVAELNARLGAVLRGRRWTTGGGDTIRAGDIVVSPSTIRAWRAGAPLDLGPTEFNLLAELIRNAGAVVTRAMLLERVWGYDVAPATNIVDTYVCRLRARLAARGADDPIVTMRGIGYMLRA